MTRWFFFGLFMCAAGAVSAQDWSDYISEEMPDPPEFSCYENGNQGFITAVQCDGRYCDNMRFACDFSYDRTNSGVFDSGNVEDNQQFRCMDGFFISEVGCFGDYCGTPQVTCTPLATPAPTITVTQASNNTCNTSIQISEETPNNKLVLQPGQLFAGMSCSGKDCDNKEFLVCDAFEGQVPVAGSWHKVRSSAGSDIDLDVVTGRILTNTNAATNGLDLKAGVSAGAKGVTVNTEATSSQSSTVSTENGSQAQVEIEIDCIRPDDKQTVELYQFVLGNGQPQTMQQAQSTRCHYYGPGDTLSAPQCWPSSCSTDTVNDPYCQVCTDSDPLTPIDGLDVSGLYVNAN